MKDPNIDRELPADVAILEGYTAGATIVQKFGMNTDVDAAEDIVDAGGDYKGFAVAAEALNIVSSSASDAAAGVGARTVLIEGLDVNYAAISETLTLNGTTPVVGTLEFFRVLRIRVLTAGTSLTNVGTLTLKQNVTTANVFSVMPIGFGVSQNTNYTVPAGKRFYMKHIDCCMNDTTANAGTMAIKVIPYLAASRTTLLVRPFAIATTKNFVTDPVGGILFEAKTDLVFRCLTVTNANAIIAVNWDGFLVDV